jgi:hypothetical protein
MHPLGDALADRRHVRDRGRRAGVKADRAVVESREDPAPGDDVQMHEAPERPIEALHEVDGAGLAAVDAAVLRLRILPPGDLLHEEPVLRRQRGGAQGEHPANFMGRREDPLPHWDAAGTGLVIRGNSWRISSYATACPGGGMAR